LCITEAVRVKHRLTGNDIAQYINQNGLLKLL